MPPTTGYSFGDIVLVPFPFTDQSAAKRRPAVVVSSAAYHRGRRDLIIMAVTSQTRPAATLGEMKVTDWKAAGLIKPSVIKPVITTIDAASSSAASGGSRLKTRKPYVAPSAQSSGKWKRKSFSADARQGQ